MRPFTAELARHMAATAPGPSGIRAVGFDLVPDFGLWDWPMDRFRAKMPIGPSLWPAPFYREVKDPYDPSIAAPGRFPMQPGLAAMSNPPMPGNALEGAFPPPTLPWMLARVEAFRNEPSAWAIARDRYASRQLPIRRSFVARNRGPIGPTITGGESTLTRGRSGLGWWCCL